MNSDGAWLILLIDDAEASRLHCCLETLIKSDSMWNVLYKLSRQPVVFCILQLFK